MPDGRGDLERREFVLPFGGYGVLLQVAVVGGRRRVIVQDCELVMGLRGVSGSCNWDR